jgi:CHAP domain
MPLPYRRSHVQVSVSLLMLALMLALAVLAGCAAPWQHAGVAPVASPGTVPPTSTADVTDRYVDVKLGFSLALPPGWQALAEPGQRASDGESAVTLIPPDERSSHALVVVGVLRGPDMAAAFAARGMPTGRIGPYPAFSDDRGPGVARVPCLVRIFLAGSDYVMADWCAIGSAAHAADFDTLLASYMPRTPSDAPYALRAPAPQTCAQTQAQLGYPDATGWGRQLATPDTASPAGGWNGLATGASVCSNEASADQYLFQCTELANRYLYEQWALPHLPGTAARYVDYVQDGTRHPGVVRDLPAGSYQLSDDATQGHSAFRPQPGDLLVFQDVRDPRAGWTSGLTTSPGHVAVITAVDATHVYVAQENYNETQYFLALPMATAASGYAITDLSGLPDRIVRGWIHFTVNGGAA